MIKLKPFINTARVWAENSSCARLKVGACIINMETRRLLSIGYNGTISGMHNCNDIFIKNNEDYYVSKDILKYMEVDLPFEHDGFAHIDKDNWLRHHHLFSDKLEVHAEQNAIYNLIKTGASYDTDNLAIVCTHAPCRQCAKAIAALGIKYVFYINEYDNNEEIVMKYFNSVGVICRQVQDDCVYNEEEEDFEEE